MAKQKKKAKFEELLSKEIKPAPTVIKEEPVAPILPEAPKADKKGIPYRL